MDDLERLVAIDQIRQLEAKRARLLDLQDWTGYAALHTPEITSEPQDGVRLLGLEAMMAWLREQLAGALTIHHVHSPEISFAGPDRASGIWAMSARSVFRQADREWWRNGYGFYHVAYERRDGQWLIAGRTQQRLRVDEGEGRPTAS